MPYSKDMDKTPTTPMMTDEAMADFYARNASKQVYATSAYTPRKRLQNTTWCLGDKPNAQLAHDLLWCDKRKGRS